MPRLALRRESRTLPKNGDSAFISVLKPRRSPFASAALFGSAAPMVRGVTTLVSARVKPLSATCGRSGRKRRDTPTRRGRSRRGSAGCIRGLSGKREEGLHSDVGKTKLPTIRRELKSIKGNQGKTLGSPGHTRDDGNGGATGRRRDQPVVPAAEPHYHSRHTVRRHIGRSRRCELPRHCLTATACIHTHDLHR